jgi:DNA-binding response OmpR family regulator
MSNVRIVYVEDEPDIRDLVVHGLRREGYEVGTAGDGREGLELVNSTNPDLVLLDLLLPSMDGLEVFRRLRESTRTRTIPVIMISARVAEADVVLGLELGAEDYIPKPFGMRELIARVRAVLRRRAAGSGERMNRVVSIQDLEVDPTRHRVTVGGEEVSLTSSEFRLLYYLVLHPGRVHTRGRLLEAMSGGSASAQLRNVDVHIASIRKKLGVAGQLIYTRRGVGYLLDDPERFA